MDEFSNLLTKRGARMPKLSASSEPFEVKILTLEETITEWAETWCRDISKQALIDLKRRIELI